MGKKSVEEFYDQRWMNSSGGSFWGYERNRVLPRFFPLAEGRERLLDVGCGDGRVAAYLHRRGYKVWGIDASREAIVKAKKRGIGHFTVSDIETGLPYKTSFFDIVFLGDLLEHLFDPEAVLNEVKRVLKRGGKVVISCPNMGFWVYRWHYFKTGSVPCTEGHRCEVWQTGHIRFFNLRILRRFLEEVGFRPQRVSGVSKGGVDSFLCRIWPSLFASIIVMEAESLK